MAQKTCCPTGYTYITQTGTYIDTFGNMQIITNFNIVSYNVGVPCYQQQANTVYGTPVGAIDCGCCPANYTIANGAGYITLLTGNVILIGPQVANQCVSLQDYTVTAIPGDCPCCPQGYVYFSGFGKCINQITGLKDTVATIPCIVCICPLPAPFECTTCTSGAVPISFSLNTNTKNCIECGIDESPRESKDRKLNSFVPAILIDSVIIFKLR